MRTALPAIALLAALGTATASAEVRLDLSGATVAAPGDTARVCVSLATGGQEVAGTQNDLVWDGTCATVPDDSACVATGSHGKDLQTRIQASEDFRLRALVLSLTDVDPIADGELYCCDVTIEAAPGACCDIAVVDAGASDSKGNAVPVSGSDAELCVAATGAPTPTATPRPGGTDDDGCQVAPAGGAGAAPLLAALALLLARRRR